MKRSKFSEAQIAFILKQAEDGTSVGEVWAIDAGPPPKMRPQTSRSAVTPSQSMLGPVPH
jgi:hypothetical protein